MAQATKAVEGTAKGAEDAAKKADTAMGQMVKSAQNNRQAWDTVGATLTGFGAASVGALGLATKAAMDWESSWAGVQKTVDGTAPQMAALEDGLRGLARELPVTHAEIAGVAEAAGQLGIETPNIVDFTRTMVNMGVATNLSSEEAASSLARFVNITGTSQQDIGKLGAAIVGLGNNYATTESEILQMSMRLAGAGAQANMSEGDILGMATALTSVGIEAEAGGSAMSQTMKRIGKAVDEGGASLDLFAQVSGMSAEQFSEAWKNDPALALDGFINGLSGVEAQGMTTNGVLAELGITGIRESDALLRLSAASSAGADGMSLLASAVQDGNAEFEKGSALIDEASKRYETAESRIQLAKNALVDAGISIGGVVLPAFAELADAVADVAGWFADLPAPVHGVVAALGGIAGAGALAAGSFLLIFPRVMDTVQAFKTLKNDMPGVTSGLGKVGKVAGVAAAAFVGLQVLGAVVDHFAEARITAEEFTASLLNAASTSEVTAASIDGLIEATGTGNATVTDLGNALDILDAGGFAKFMDQVNAGFGVWDTQGEIAAEQVGKLDQALTTLAQAGSAEQMSEAWTAALDSSGRSASELLDALPGLRAELTNVATGMELTADDATLVAIMMGEIVPPTDAAGDAAAGFAEELSGVEQAANDAVAATDDYRQSLLDLSNEFITAERAALDYSDSLEETAEAASKNGKAWEDGTEAADENKRALLDLADQALATADSLAAEGKSGTFLEKAREDLIDVATEMTGSKELAEEYVDQLLGTPEEIETLVELETEQAKADLAALWDELGYNPPEVPVSADTTPADEKVGNWTGLLSDQPPTDVSVGADTDPATEGVGAFVGATGEASATVGVNADVEPAMEDVYQLDYAIQDAGGTVTINGNATPGNDVLNTLMAEINAGDGTVTIDGQSYPADQALGAAIDAINRGEGTVTIEGNNKPANSATDGAKRHADGTTGTIDVEADTGGAESATNHAARDRSSNVNQTASTGSAESALNHTARNRTSRITVFQSVRTSGSATARAAGGPVFGPGTGTSDSIPALLSNGEHVITAKEVAQAGGQDAIYRMREAIRSGFKFANGGAVERGAQGPVAYSSPPVSMRPSSSDGVGVAQAVSAAMSSWQPMVNIGGREFAGVMMQGNSRIHAMGGRR